VLEQLTTEGGVVIISNMKAVVLIDERHVIAEDAFVEIVVWQVPQPVRRSAHGLKYRLALVAEGECMLRYDNEAGKGDHRHVGEVETPYAFRSYERLLEDFWSDVEAWRQTR
jgi:pyridoxal biosynthesis lyase PdxS